MAIIRYAVPPSICRIMLAALAGTLGISAAMVEAQEPQPYVIPQFSFSNPGARSLGFGGAFVALADDATAGYANPAGLTQLTEPEVSLEGRLWNFSTPYTLGGRVEGAPSGFGLDHVAGLRTAKHEANLAGLSFVSLVYPSQRWSLALYRHQLADFEFSGRTQGLFHGGSSCCQRRFLDQQSSSSLNIATYGISAAYEISETLSVGGGLALFDASIRAQAATFFPNDNSVASILGTNAYLPERMFLNVELAGDQTDLGFNLGVLWNLFKSWRIGVVYRAGPEVESGALVETGAAFPGVPAGTVLETSRLAPISLPDVYGLGLSYRAPDGRSTFAFEWDRVTYSDALESIGVEDSVIDDANELHLGGEYVFLESNPITALRLGAWFDPDHQTRAFNATPFQTALLRPGADQIHFAFGVGLAFRRFQVDFGVDLSETVKTASVSTIYSF